MGKPRLCCNIYNLEKVNYMSDWEQVYQSRTVELNKALEKINHSDEVFLAPYCNEPQTLVKGLIDRKESLKGLTLTIGVAGSPLLYAEEANIPYFNIKTYLSSPKLRMSMDAGKCHYVPVSLSEVPKYISNSQVDVALIHVSPPDENGNCNVGTSVEAIHTLVERADYVIAEVNDQMPVTVGDTSINVENIDAFVHSSNRLLEIKEGQINDIEKKIGENVASLIPDGATIQWGVGNIPNSVLYALENKRDLGVHSGSISDPIINLIEKGVITNKYKNIDKNKSVCSLLLGTEKLYRYVENNPLIEMRSVNYTHNGATIGKLDNFHSINSALEVSLTGQVNAESIGTKTIAGVGGQIDFIRGAQYSKGGKAIIALPSTTRDGKKSRISATVNEVTTVKSEVQYVVTEYGVANIFGKTLNERAEALIAIAHPDFRNQLRTEWESNK